ncbi:amidohydrolase [Corynebacterium sp. HS2168-gen11]|uniref:amidohydrolase n=1 Tax=Corynebacterium sp. HS2168-gen11 TaxID=2974027 RepID=UPI00216B055D|nr:amidohydrolase [Corynebacterium sp. HS2168-gen11]MCS4536252.1 amidohydrolase [Corynebacterium sp. HS2168-gen11]
MNIATALSAIDLLELQGIYQHLHAYPELSGQEEETAAYIVEKLGGLDCTVTAGIGGHGVVAVFHNGPGKTVLMRADFDGLPVTEATGVPFTSQNAGVMHACGHDIHTTALLALCQILDTRRDQWSGTFIALFQPSEENGAGALAMLNDGLAQHIPTPDVCLGQHVTAGPAGSVMTRPGPILAASDSIEILLEGKSAHGSMPHNSIDPTYLAAMIVVRLQGIVGREISPAEFAVVSVGTLESGHSNNTIPGTARIVLNCRTYNDVVKAKLYASIERVVRGECFASGTPVEPSFRYFAHAPLTDNTHTVFDDVRPLFDAHFGPLSLDATPWTASEDFSQVPRAFDAPYFFWFIGGTPQDVWDQAVATDPLTPAVPANHMPDFLPDFEPTIRAGIEASLIAVSHYLHV